MNVGYRRELNHNYLVIRQEDFQDQYQVGMLAKNRIPGLLECRISLVDGHADFYYEITSRQSLRLILERKRISGAELRMLLEELQRAAEACEEYLLNPGGILLNPEYIYLDPDRWEASFCCFPFADVDLQGGMLGLAEYLLERLDRQDSEAVTLGYEFYRMAGEENLSLEQQLLKWRDACGQEEKLEKDEERICAESGIYKVQEDRAKQPLEKKGSVDPPEQAETVFLKRGPLEGMILRSENPAYPDLYVTGESFLIGKKKDAVDGLLKARGISRIHGKISREEGKFYLSDLNSTNGTFLNGGRLEVNEKAQVREGDRVGFADVKYVVDLSGELLYNKSERSSQP